MLGYHILILCFLFTTGPLGLILNATFIYFTIRHKELRKGYTYFLCAIMGINTIYCMNNFILQTIVIIFNIEATQILCTVVGLILTTNGIAAVCVQSLLAVNRFCSLHHSHLVPKYFSTRNNTSMLICTYIFCFSIAIIQMILGDMKRVGNTICGPAIESMAISHICLFATPMFLSYSICIFSGYKIFSLVKNHQAMMAQQEMRSRIQDAKEIVHLIIFELSVPIVLETPVLIISFLTEGVHVPPMVMSISVCLFITHPVLDPIIVVIVMKPYRNFVKQTWYKWRGITTVQQVSGMNVPA